MDSPIDAAPSTSTLHRDRMASDIGAQRRHSGMAWAVGQALLLHIAVLAVLIAGLSGSPEAPSPGARGTINVDLMASSALSAAMQHTLSPPIPPPTAVDEAPPPEPALPEPPVEPEVPAEPETPVEPSVPETIIPQAQTAGGESGSTGAGEALRANPDLSVQEFSDRRLRVLAIRRANRASQTFSVSRSTHVAAQRQPAARVSGSVQARTPATLPEPVGIRLDATWVSSIDTDAAGERLLTAYEEQLQASILPNWLIPEAAPFDQSCLVSIEQSAQGEILNILVDELCPFPEDAKASIHDALLASQPLPYEGFETLPIRAISLDFRRHAPGRDE